MLRRILLYGSILVIIVAFAFVLGVGWNQDSGKSAEVGKCLDDLTYNINFEHWESAEAALKELEAVWAIVYPRLDFIQERLPLFQFETDLARVRGAILAQDRVGGMQLSMELKSIWAAF